MTGGARATPPDAELGELLSDAYVAGYFLRASAPTQPLGLLADLLSGLGPALWTGVVVAALVHVIPEAKRRQITRALEADEAIQRERPRQSGDGSSRR
ncbi:MAG: hypothetical protein ACJ765_02175 [Chloroflexota bacterium]